MRMMDSKVQEEEVLFIISHALIQETAEME